MQKNVREMKEHPFTSLCELLRKQDPEILSIFDRNAVSTSVQQNQTKPRLTEMIVATRPIMNKDDAKQRIDDLLARISNCGDNYFAVFQEMSKVLTTDGIGRLLVMLKGNLSDEFLKDNNIQYLFKGMPIFKIVVKEDDFVRSKTDGISSVGILCFSFSNFYTAALIGKCPVIHLYRVYRTCYFKSFGERPALFRRRNV